MHNGSSTTLQHTGRSWVFGPHINTDLMFPTAAILASAEERRKLVFEAIRPGWHELVEEGDVIVAGANFGTGSGRPAAQVLKELGIRALVADSINGLFYRSCVNYALPAMECPGISTATKEGDVLEIDFTTGSVRNTRSSAVLAGSPLPPFVADLILRGGLIPHLRSMGYVEDRLPE